LPRGYLTGYRQGAGACRPGVGRHRWEGL